MTTIEQVARQEARRKSRKLMGLPEERSTVTNCPCCVAEAPSGWMPMGPDPKTILDAERLRLLTAFQKLDPTPAAALMQNLNSNNAQKTLRLAQEYVRERAPHLTGERFQMAVSETLSDPKFLKMLKEHVQ